MSVSTTIPAATLPTRTCADNHPLVLDTEHYDSPRFVHVSIADLMACAAYADDYGTGK